MNTIEITRIHNEKISVSIVLFNSLKQGVVRDCGKGLGYPVIVGFVIVVIIARGTPWFYNTAG